MNDCRDRRFSLVLDKDDHNRDTHFSFPIALGVIHINVYRSTERKVRRASGPPGHAFAPAWFVIFNTVLMQWSDVAMMHFSLIDELTVVTGSVF
jgi:hypothetical protein